MVGDRSINADIGNFGKECNVKNAVMRGTVGGIETCTVNAEHDGQVLQSDIVHNIIVGALQKAGIDGNHGAASVCGKSCGKGDSVGLGNTNVKKACGMLCLECGKPRSRGHCGSNGTNTTVLFCKLGQVCAHLLGEIVSVRMRCSGRMQGVVAIGVLLGRGVALPFFCMQMDQAALSAGFGFCEQLLNGALVVAVNRTEIVEPEVFKGVTSIKHILDGDLCAQETAEDGFADQRNFLQEVCRCTFGFEISLCRAQLGKRKCQAPDVLGDRHLVFIENNDKAQILAAVIECLVDHTARKSTVAKHANGIRIRAAETVCLGKTEGGRKRGGAMPCSKGIVLALTAFGKTADAAAMSQSVKHLAAPCDQLVRVALVTNVKNDMIVGRRKDAVNGKCHFNCSKIGCEVSAVFLYTFNDGCANFVSQSAQLCRRHIFQVIGVIDALKMRIATVLCVLVCHCASPFCPVGRFL